MSLIAFAIRRCSSCVSTPQRICRKWIQLRMLPDMYMRVGVPRGRIERAHSFATPLAEQVLIVVKGVGVELGDLLLHQVDGGRIQIIVAGLLVLEVLGPQVGQANGAELVDRAVALRELLEAERAVPQHLSRDCPCGVDLHLHAGHLER